MISSIVLVMGLPSAVCYLLMATIIGPVLGQMDVIPLAAHFFKGPATFLQSILDRGRNTIARRIRGNAKAEGARLSCRLLDQWLFLRVIRGCGIHWIKASHDVREEGTVESAP